MRRSIRILGVATLAIPALAFAADVIEIDLNAPAREHCHILKFPLGWKMPHSLQTTGLVITHLLGLQDDLVFRVAGLQGSKFLIRGVEELSEKYYSINVYQADFSDPKGIAQPATDEQWQAGTPVSVARDTYKSGARITDESHNYAELEARRFLRTGEAWGMTRLSPDRTILVVESWSGTLGRCGGNDYYFDPFCINIRGPHGKLFFDVYSVDTGKKVITLSGKFNKIRPEDDFQATAWVTERYFIIPLDSKRERCLVCEFGRGR